MLWVSTNIHLTFMCIVRVGSPATGSGSMPPSEASLQCPLTVQKVCVPCPKPGLATFTGARALTGDFKELWVLCKTDKMPIPRGSCSQSRQKQNHGRTTLAPGAHERDRARRLLPSCPLVFEVVPVSFLREQEEIHQAKVILSAAPWIPQPNSIAPRVIT